MNSFLIVLLILMLVVSIILDIIRIKTDKEVEKRLDKLEKGANDVKLLENIGLGLFVNALYSIMNLNFEPAPFIVLVLSVTLIGMSIYSQRKKTMSAWDITALAGVKLVIDLRKNKGKNNEQ